MRHAPSRSFRPAIEALEDRQLLTAPTFTGSVLNQRFVGQVYEDLLGRSADAIGRPYWAGFLDREATRVQVAIAIENTDEYRSVLVKDLYRKYLERDAEAGGLNYFVGKLAQGKSADDVRAEILASPEYFTKQGKGTVEGFLAALRQDVLGSESATVTSDTTTTEENSSETDDALRVRGLLPNSGDSSRASTTTSAANNPALATNSKARQDEALRLIKSPEGRAQDVIDLYERLLERTPEQAGINYWVGLFNIGAKYEHVVGGILGAQEYSDRLEYDVVMDWNDLALQAIRQDQSATPLATRNLALLNTAMYDAINAVEPLHHSYQATGLAPELASVDVAAAAAAHRVLTNLYPAQKDQLDTALAKSLGKIDFQGTQDPSLAFGRSIADARLNARKNDGTTAAVEADTPSTKFPAPPPYSSVVLPDWQKVQPFAITAAEDYRTRGLQNVDTFGYLLDYMEVKDIGSAKSTSRTADQTAAARFWNDGAGTATLAGIWNQIATKVAAESGTTAAENARLFAWLNMAMADADIASWNAKAFTLSWRPVTAIRQGDSDANAVTQGDTTWTPLLVTPPSPSYTSEHSAVSGAASTILAAVFGDTRSFDVKSEAAQGTTRSFSSFSAAAEEAGLSRVWGGVQFRIDHTDGLAQGKAIAGVVFNNHLG